MNDFAINERIKYLIESILNISPYDFSKKIGNKRPDGLYKILKNEVKPSSKTLSKISKAYPEYNDWLLTGKEAMLNLELEEKEEQPEYKVPLLPISAIGGALNDFSPSVMEYQTEQIISPIKNIDFAIKVSGESMYPEYPQGSVVLIKKINERIFIEWGEPYVLDTKNGVVLKNVHKGETDNEIICRSVNPNFAPFSIPINEIYGFYRVLGLVCLK